MVSVKRMGPMERWFWSGSLPLNQWVDLFSMHEAMLTFEGMLPGDRLVIQGSIADKPNDNNAYEVKAVDKDGEVKIGGYRWYRILSISQAPVIVWIYGSN